MGHSLRHHGVHHRFDSRSDCDTPPSDRIGHSRGVYLPAKCSRHADSDHCGTRIPGWCVCFYGDVRILDQHAQPAGHGPGGGLGRGRCDRRRGKRHAPPGRRWTGLEPGDERGPGGSAGTHCGDNPGDDGGLRPGVLHSRYDGTAIQPILAHDRRGRRVVGDQLPDAQSRAVCGPATPGKGQKELSFSRIQHCLRSNCQRLRRGR